MRIRVVVADDFPLVRQGVVTAIQTDPDISVVGQAGDTLGAMRLAHELRPDVILLDLRMPGEGGLVALERLREELPDVRAIVMTASERSDTLLKAMAAGAAGYLSKRATARELIDALITVHGGGSALSPQLAAELLRDYSAASRGEQSHAQPLLTPREHDVLSLVTQGLTDREIAARLYISPRTVQNQLAAVRRKTGRRRRAELSRWATEHLGH